jgi:hypothetical protein
MCLVCTVCAVRVVTAAAPTAAEQLLYTGPSNKVITEHWLLLLLTLLLTQWWLRRVAAAATAAGHGSEAAVTGGCLLQVACRLSVLSQGAVARCVAGQGVVLLPSQQSWCP